jgi:hypothetical protein
MQNATSQGWIVGVLEWVSTEVMSHPTEVGLLREQASWN